jgi:HPt (histidine-containing phosphotransfer) domain-containing protein
MVARLGGDEALTRQLVSLFLTECPRMMAAVRESVSGGSADTIRRAAHAFKGSVSNFTDRGAVLTAFELESMGRDGRVAEAPEALAKLEHEVTALTARLRVFEAGP